jgi:glutamate-1-semialdehyde 2,1-aminomutase
MLQYYLRAEGLALSWVGTGRFIFALDVGEADYQAVAARFLAAAERMRDDGWWWGRAGLTDRSIRRRILREIVAHRLGL